MLPFVYEELENEIDDDVETELESDVLPREYGVDFETSKLTGKVVEGVEAIKVWAWLALQTQRNRFYIYTVDYGHDFESLIGKGYTKEFIRVELKRLIEECLFVHPNITAIENFDCTFKHDAVTARFDMVTDFGTDVGVEINV